MQVTRLFTKNLSSPYANQDYEERKSEIREPDGRVVFSQSNVAVPKDWSQVATDILAQKYFRRTGVPQANGGTGGENDARQVFHRLAGCWTDWAKKFDYFSSEEDAKCFYDELCYMLSHQIAAPNSPQWFNTGLYYAYGINGPAQGHYYVDPTTGVLTASQSSYEHPQPHACFIQSVQDDLVNEDGIMDLWIREARLFKYGSGTGTNFSNLRSDGEKLGGGGRSSGLMSFLKIGDRAAGAIKSGGTTRRAAKMVCLDLDHPEIESFINWKVNEEQKVSALVAGSKIHRKLLKEVLDACFRGDESVEIDPKKNADLKKAMIRARASHIPDGFIARTLQLASQHVRELDFPEFDVDWQNEAYQTVSGQNSNNSVRVPNTFFKAVEEDGKWQLKYRASKSIAKEISARDLWDQISYAAWASADPGVQCDTTINEWHTCPEEGRINASNPCSEYMFLDDTACNLASINLIHFYNEKTGEFEVEPFLHAVRLWTMVLEISVLMAQFPSRAIAQKSYEYRTLGLGYANLGALLMSMGIPYGSEKAQAITGALTAIMTGESYATSSEMAKELGAFPKYELNKKHMLKVLRNHRRAAVGAKRSEYEDLSVLPTPIHPEYCPVKLFKAAQTAWDRAIALGEKYGYRNAQTTVIAPTGTIGLIMDCDTTGIEPDFSLVKFKKLAGGGYFKIINQSVPRALRTLGYSATEVKEVVQYCVGSGSIENAPHINHGSLQEKGFSKEIISKIEKDLKAAFDLSFAVSPHSVGLEFCTKTLNLTESHICDPSFSLLNHLGFTQDQIDEANDFVFGRMTVEGAPHLKDEHYAVFDCANRCGKYGTRYLAPMKHVDMMAAAQPFISGAISKTVNMSNDATIEDIQGVYIASWRKMVKAISIYRDGSKLSQPLNATAVSSLFNDLQDDDDAEIPNRVEEILQMDVKTLAEKAVYQSKRRELPKRRFGYTVKATIAGQRVYLRTGEYEDGNLGEIFVDVYKEGAAYRSLMNAFAISVSLGLQYGVPLDEFVNKFNHFRFEPNGHVLDHDNIKFCASIVDFIFRDLAMNYLGRHDLVHVPPKEERMTVSAAVSSVQTMGAYATSSSSASAGVEMSAGGGGMQTVHVHTESDFAITTREFDDDLAMASRLAKTKGYEGDPCTDCGQFTLVRGGTCLRCVSCGTTSGCS